MHRCTGKLCAGQHQDIRGPGSHDELLEVPPAWEATAVFLRELIKAVGEISAEGTAVGGGVALSGLPPGKAGRRQKRGQGSVPWGLGAVPQEGSADLLGQ